MRADTRAYALQRRVMRRRLFAAGLLAVLLPLAVQADPIDAYVAARDRAIAASLAAAKAGKADDPAVHKQEEAAAAELARLLSVALGPLAFKGMGPPRYSLGTFAEDAATPTRRLDGLAFATADYSTRLVVTPEAVFTAWLAARVKDDGAPRALRSGLPAAVGTAEFFQNAIAGDGGYFQPYVALPVAASPDETAFAVLGLQVDEPAGTTAPNEIAILRIGHGRAVVGMTMAKLTIGPIPACEAVWTPFKVKADALARMLAKEKKPSANRQDEITRLASDGTDAYRACFAREAPKQAFFTAAVKAAEAFLALARGN